VLGAHIEGGHQQGPETIWVTGVFLLPTLREGIPALLTSSVIPSNLNLLSLSFLNHEMTKLTESFRESKDIMHIRVLA
jgi:hypothetical protein